MLAQRNTVKRVIRLRRMSVILLVLPAIATGCASSTPDAIAPSTVPAETEPGEPSTSSAVSAEQLAIAAAVGDIEAGEELFNQPVDGVSHSWSCSSCHSLDGSDSQDGPTLAGISAVAADRVVGLSDVDYLRQSIVDPYAFRADGEWRGVMPYQYSELLSDDQVNNLIAFLLTR